VRLGDLKYARLRAIISEVVRAVLLPAVQNRFVLPMIVTSSDHELVLHPDQARSIGPACVLQIVDKDGQHFAGRHCGVQAGTGFGSTLCR
jgi:hypothetical protein